MTSPSALDRARAVLAANRYLVLATQDANGPWAAALAYTLIDGSFYFFSERASRHGAALLSGGPVAGVIYNSQCAVDEAESIQFSGHGVLAHERGSIAAVLAASGAIPTDAQIADEFSKTKTALFRVTPTKVFVLDQTLYSTESVDGREPVVVSELFA